MTEITKPKKDSNIDHDATSNRTHEGDNLGNSALANSAVTVAGKSVSLGSSVGIGHGDLAGIDEGDHHTKGVATFVQDTQPSNPGDGETWFEPATRIYRIRDSGQWRPVPPVATTEEAITFGESDVSLSTNNTEVSGGSVDLVEGPTGNVVSRDPDDSSNSLTNRAGLVINPNTDLTGVIVTESGNTSASTAYLQDTNGNVLDSAGLSGGEATLSSSLTTGTKYYVGLDGGGSGYTQGSNNSTSFDYSGTDLDIVNGVHSMGSGGSPTSSTAYSIIDVEGVLDATDGSVTVSWDTGVPEGINSWDLATFSRTLDGETVTIDVLDGSGTVLFSDIGQNFDISTVDNSKDVQIRANLSRSNTSNNPRLDYAARRFTR